MTKAFDAESRRGPIARETTRESYETPAGAIPGSGPADPRQRVSNDKRTPQPYEDLTQTPNITGTYFEKDGRYRLFINQAGGHIECLLTLVVQDAMYHKPREAPKRRGKKRGSLDLDERIPFDWGIEGYLARPSTRRRNPIAFRFAGDFVKDVWMLRIPVWLGRSRIDPDNPGMGTYELGYMVADGDGDTIRPSFRGWFVDRWPEADTSFGIAITVPMLDTVATRTDRNPVLLDRYLARDSVPFHVRTHYWFPPTPKQVATVGAFAREVTGKVVEVDPKGYVLRKGGAKMDIYDLLQAERTLGMTYPDPLHRDNIITAIDEIVFKVFNSATTTPISRGGLGLADLEHMRTPVLKVLDAWKLAESDGHGEQSVGTALQRAVDRAGSHASFRHMQAHLGIKPRGWRKFRYEVDVQAFKMIDFEDKKNEKRYKDAGKLFKKLKKKIEKVLEGKNPKFAKFKRLMKYLPLTGLIAHVHVKYVGVVEGETGGPADAPWEASYMLLLGGVSKSVSFGDGTKATLSGPTELWAATPPVAEDLEGTAFLGEGSLFGGMKIETDYGTFDDSLVAAKSVLTFFGSSQEPAVSFFFNGQMTDGKGGAGFSGKALYGQAILLDGTGSKIELEPEEKERTDFEGYWSTHIPALAVHFPINGARLPVATEKEEDWMEQEGLVAVRDALNAFAACELPLIMNPFAVITMEGYADPPGTFDKNLELSLNRANSVRNYLHSILGDTFTFGVTEVQEDENGFSMGRLYWAGRGEPEKKKTEEVEVRKGEEFDPKLRRCDVAIELRVPEAGKDSSLTWKVWRSEKVMPP